MEREISPSVSKNEIFSCFFGVIQRPAQQTQAAVKLYTEGEGEILKRKRHKSC